MTAPTYQAAAAAVRGPASAGAGQSRADLAVAYAQAQIGKPYVFGAAGPDSFDCSGLTMRAWQAAGLDVLSHWTVAQWAETQKRPFAQAQPGDLIFYGAAPAPHHVALYVGGGMQIAAPDVGQPVVLQKCYGGDQLDGVGIMPGAGAYTGGAGSSGGASAVLDASTGVLGTVIDAFNPIFGLMPWNWAGDLSNAQKSLTQTLISWSLKLAFVGGGITLAVLGAYQTLPKPASPTA